MKANSSTGWSILLAFWAILTAMLEVFAVAELGLQGASTAQAMRAIPIFHLILGSRRYF